MKVILKESNLISLVCLFVLLPSHVQLFATPWTAAHQASVPQVYPSSCSLHRWCHPAISYSDTLFSFCPQSFPASGTFPLSQLFTSSDQNTGASASASVLPMSFQGWFPLRLTGLMSLLSRGLSGVFSGTIIPRHQFFGILLSLWSALTTGRPLLSLASVNCCLKMSHILSLRIHISPFAYR